MAFLLIFIDIGCERSLTNSITSEEPTIVTVKPKEYSRALRNPLKGFRARREVFDHEYGTLWHSYIRWNSIENDENDGIDKIKTFCDQYWKDAENHNIKVIPRVYLDWDEKEGNEYWPADMRTGDYSSEQFRQRVVRLVRRLGQLWDNDPRVAFVEMGIVGYWGEHHHPSFSELNGMEELLGLAFTKAFKNKLVTVRRPWQFADYEFGVHWDSWAHIQEVEAYGGGIAELNDKKHRWQICPIGGECAYNWGQYEQQPGKSPDDTLRDPNHLDWLLYTIRWLHCTELGWVADYDQKDPKVRAGAQKVQKAFGFRFILDEVCYPAKISPDKSFTVSFVVRNVGSAPSYYNWPVEISLLDPKTRIPVWRETFKDIDICRWLPGDKWNKTTKTYDLKPQDYQVDGTFRVPQTVESGEYIVALAILDPASMVPSLRFAVENYFEGGRHPIGLVGVGKTVPNPILDPASFDNPAEDSTLKYVLESRDTLTDLSEPILSLQEAAAIGDVNLVSSLLDKGVGVDSLDDSINKTALQYAAISGYKDVAELLLDKGADVDARSSDFFTPLYYAAQNDHMEIIQLLIARGADVNAKNNKDQTALDIAMRENHKEIVELLAKVTNISSIHAAAQLGDLEKVKAFLEEGMDVNAKDENGQTSFHIAVSNNHKDIAELLIKQGADVNAKDKYNYTPLYYAMFNIDKDMVRLLVNNGADVNITPEKDYTPIYYAVWMENLDIVKLLVDKGAKFDVKVLIDDMTALHYAALQGSIDMVELFISKGVDTSSLHMAAFMGNLDRVKELIEKGIEIDKKDEAGWTALFWAACAGHTEVAKFLIDKGADISVTDTYGRSLLHQAAQADSVKLIELLISKGADVNVKDKRGNTPLHSTSHRDVAELLIAKGADVNAKAQNNMTPLHRVAMSGHKDVVEILLANSADVTVKDSRGRTALDWAKQKGQIEIVELLRKSETEE